VGGAESWSRVARRLQFKILDPHKCTPNHAIASTKLKEEGGGIKKNRNTGEEREKKPYAGMAGASSSLGPGICDGDFFKPNLQERPLLTGADGARGRQLCERQNG